MNRTRFIQVGVLALAILLALAGTSLFQALAASHHSHHTTRKPTKTPTPVATPAPVSNPGSGNGPWSLVYSDNFAGTQLSSQWITYGGAYSIGDNAWDPSEVHVNNGLHITMEKRALNGKPYTAGGLGAMRLAMTYGKYEFSARLAKGQGVGPYAILWPQTSNHGDVEVDLFESPPPDKSKIYFTNHGNGSPSQITSSNNFGDAFHTFTYEWTPGKLDLQIDGVEQGSMTKNVPNFPMWFGLAIGSGDAFIGAPNSSTVFPTSFDINWVHIYKYTG